MNNGKVNLKDLNDIELFHRTLKELEQLTDGGVVFSLHMNPSDALAVIGMLQLALRHPKSTGPSAEAAFEIVNILAHQVERLNTPHLSELIRRGFDREHDYPR